MSVKDRVQGIWLKDTDVAEWGEEIRRLTAERDAIEEKIGELEHQIDLAQELIALIAPRPALTSPAASTQPAEDVPLPDAIEAIIKVFPMATHSVIKGELSKNPIQAERLKQSPNYYYTAMRRLKDRNKIEQFGDKYQVRSADASDGATIPPVLQPAMSFDNNEKEDEFHGLRRP